jgi:hypothetical protein
MAHTTPGTRVVVEIALGFVDRLRTNSPGAVWEVCRALESKRQRTIRFDWKTEAEIELSP